MTKLTSEQIVDIYNSTEDKKDLESKYNVCRATINNIKGKRRWNHLLKDL